MAYLDEQRGQTKIRESTADLARTLLNSSRIESAARSKGVQDFVALHGAKMEEMRLMQEAQDAARERELVDAKIALEQLRILAQLSKNKSDAKRAKRQADLLEKQIENAEREWDLKERELDLKEDFNPARIKQALGQAGLSEALAAQAGANAEYIGAGTAKRNKESTAISQENFLRDMVTGLAGGDLSGENLDKLSLLSQILSGGGVDALRVRQGDAARKLSAQDLTPPGLLRLIHGIGGNDVGFQQNLESMLGNAPPTALNKRSPTVKPPPAAIDPESPEGLRNKAAQEDRATQMRVFGDFTRLLNTGADGALRMTADMLTEGSEFRDYAEMMLKELNAAKKSKGQGGSGGK